MNYWAEVEDLASYFSTSPVVSRLKDAITAPVNSDEQYAWSDGISQLKVMFSGEVRQPFKLAQQLPFIYGALPEIDLPQQFINDAVLAHQASAAMLAWFRARLPNYPVLKTPHFGRNTHLTTDEFTFRIPWRREDLSRGLQFKSLDSRIASSLQVPKPRGFEISVLNLLAAVMRTDDWADFAASSTGLTSEDVTALGAARRQVTAKLAPESLDEFEPRIAIIRAGRRAQVVHEEIMNLAGRAGEYALAFDRIDALLEEIAVDFVSQFVFFGAPELIKPLDAIEFAPGEPGTITFRASDLINTGALIQIDDPIFSAHARVQEVSIQVAAGGSETISVSATLLS